MALARLCLALILLVLPLLGGKLGVLPVAVFAILTAGGWTAWAAARPRPSLPALPLRWPLAALLLVTLLATLTSVYRPASWLGWWQVAVIAAAALLAAVLPLERRHLALGVALFALGTFLGLWYGYHAWVGWIAQYGKEYGVFTWRLVSTWENANFYAGFLLLTLPLLAVLAVHARRRAWQLTLGALAVLMLATLVLTQSRGGLLALLLAMLFFGPAWLWVTGKLSARGLALLAAGFVLFVGLALLSPVGKRVLDPALRAKQLHSQMFRYYTWAGTLRLARAYPLLGAGPNTFPSVFGQYQLAGYTRAAHHIYLQAAAETGVPGLLALLWLFGGVVVIGVRAMRSKNAAPAAEDATEPPAAPVQKSQKTSAPAEPSAWALDGLFPADDGRLRALAGVALLAGTIGLLLHGLVDSDWLCSGVQLALLLQAVLVWRLLPAAPAARPAPLAVRIAVPLVLLVGVLVLWPATLAEQLANRAQLLADYRAQAEVYHNILTLAPANAAYLRRASTVAPPEEAADLLRRAQVLEPTNADNWLFQGQFALSLGQFAEAARAFRTAEAKHPHLLPALFFLAKSSWLAKDDATARQAIARLLATRGTPVETYRPVEVPEPWYTLAWYAQGQFALRDHDAATARRCFAQAIAAAAAYERGYTIEAKAWALLTNTSADQQHLRVIAALAHARLVTLDPAHAAAHRTASAREDLAKVPGDVPFP